MKLSPDPVSELLGTGYSRFENAAGMNGLCKIEGNTFDILAVVATRPGNGQFRHFIICLKAKYTTIKIWDVMNPWLVEVLLRYGFRPWEERLCFQGEWETCHGFRWDR